MTQDHKSITEKAPKCLILIRLHDDCFTELRDALSDKYRLLTAGTIETALSFMDRTPSMISAVIFRADMINDGIPELMQRMDADKRFAAIPVIAAQKEGDSDSFKPCMNAGVKEYLQPPFDRELILLRLNNAIRSTDAMTFREIEIMLRKLPSSIYLKDAEGRYIFVTHPWYHLHEADEPGWTIRGKTDPEIRTDKENAQKAMESDLNLIKTGKGVSYIIEENSDGKQEFLHLIKSPTYDEDGNINGIIAIINNVTEHEKLKRQLEDRTDRIDAELNVAAQIQSNMLPRDFVKREKICVFASMTPAKNVGGDFYDFFFIDDDHLCMIMADVSGKGIPASLFMMISKIVLHDRARAGGSPSEILSDANVRICENNKMGLFVTVWLGILTLSTGKLVFSNAGHEYPVIMNGSGLFELAVTDNYPPVAADDYTAYIDETIDLSRGGTIFLYTDGVPEARNAGREFFGTDRMLKLLNKNRGTYPEDIIRDFRRELDSFIGKAEQFDDITMMCISYNGTGQ